MIWTNAKTFVLAVLVFRWMVYWFSPPALRTWADEHRMLIVVLYWVHSVLLIGGVITVMRQQSAERRQRLQSR